MLCRWNDIRGVDGVEYCQFETFRARCSNLEVVLVTYASYGRLRLGRCVATDYGSLGCLSDVTELLDSMCSGRRQCNVDVASLRNVVQPCPSDLTSYLDASFRCVPGTANYFSPSCIASIVTDVWSRVQNAAVKYSRVVWSLYTVISLLGLPAACRPSCYAQQASFSVRVSVWLCVCLSVAHKLKNYPSEIHVTTLILVA